MNNPALDSVWEEIERRADEQERRDLAYIEPIPDDVILEAIRSGKGYPGKDRGVDWRRRFEARDRRARGLPRPRSRVTYGPLFEQVLAGSREPGEEG